MMARARLSPIWSPLVQATRSAGMAWSQRELCGLRRVAARSAQIFVDDQKAVVADVVGGHFVDDRAVGHHIQAVANADGDIDALLDEQERGAAPAQLKQRA